TRPKPPKSAPRPRDSDAPLGQLPPFGRKASVGPEGTGDTGATRSTGSSSTTAPPSVGTTAATTNGQSTLTAARSLAHSGAVRISVNGRPESVRIGASFPSSNPIFRVVSVSRSGVRIG